MARNIDFDELKDRVVILASREFSKSTLVVYMFLWMAAKGSIPGFGKVNYGIYISDSMRNGVETTMTTIRKVYLESAYLRSIFEETRLIQTEVNFVRKPRTKKEIDAYTKAIEVDKLKKENVPGRMKRTFTLVGIGASTGGRGSRDGLARPDFTVFDDILPSEADASSDTILSKAESTIEADILPGMNNNNNFSIMIGTPYSKKDSVYRRVELGTWLPIVFPRANGLPIDKDKFVSVWPDRHSWKNCSRDYKRALKSKEAGDNGPIRKLNQEHYLRIASEDERMIPDSLIQWYSRSAFENNMERYRVYITTDLTTSEETGCLSCIIAWAVNDNMDWFMQDISLTQLGISAQYDIIFAMARYYRQVTGSVVGVAIETDGNQKAHIQGLKERMLKTGQYFDFLRQKGSKFGSEGISSRLVGGSKHWRMEMMLPMFQNRKMYFPEELKTNNSLIELMDEIKGLTFTGYTSKFIDGIDGMSILNSCQIQYPAPTKFKARSSIAEVESDEYLDRLWKSENRGGGKVDAFSSYV